MSRATRRRPWTAKCSPDRTRNGRKTAETTRHAVHRVSMERSEPVQPLRTMDESSPGHPKTERPIGSHTVRASEQTVPQTMHSSVVGGVMPKRMVSFAVCRPPRRSQIRALPQRIRRSRCSTAPCVGHSRTIQPCATQCSAPPANAWRFISPKGERCTEHRTECRPARKRGKQNGRGIWTKLNRVTGSSDFGTSKKDNFFISIK